MYALIGVLRGLRWHACWACGIHLYLTSDEADARRVAGLVKFADPSGIPSEVFYGPLVVFDQPFQSPRPISGFKTGEQGLGHFVVWVDDFDRSLHFYRDLLGMSVARILVKQGRRDEALMMLAEIYCWFTEGFDTADLIDAKALLDELGK